MRKLVSGLFMSLDGVVESPGPWGFKYADEAVMRAMADGIAQADAVLMGTTTYLDFAQRWPPHGTASPMAAFLNSAPKYVASSTLRVLEWGPAELLTGDLAAAVRALKAQTGKNIQVPGSPTLVRWLLEHGLLDQLSLNIAPELVGKGRRLFDGLKAPLELALVETQRFETGLLSVTYSRLS